MVEPTYDEVLKASLNSKLLLYHQLISSFMIKFLCNVEVYFMKEPTWKQAKHFKQKRRAQWIV